MGFRYQRRINLGDGVGINVSKSGLSTSVRTKYGSFGSRGFTLRTGIPGLSWRSGFGGKNGGAVLLMILLVLGAFIIAYNLCYSTCAGKLNYHSTRAEMCQEGRTNGRLGPFEYSETRTATVLKHHIKSLDSSSSTTTPDETRGPFCEPQAWHGHPLATGPMADSR